MSKPQIGQPAPEFSLPATGERTIRLSDLRGRKVRGIERSTFLIDADGILRREWRGVKVPGHASEVLDAARSL